MDITLIYLFIIYQLKHFVADYLLQGAYMLGKFKPGWDFIPPLAAHCAVHMAFTFCIVVFFVSPELAITLAVADFVIHFVMDRIKASPHMLGRYPKENPRFWWAPGMD